MIKQLPRWPLKLLMIGVCLSGPFGVAGGRYVKEPITRKVIERHAIPGTDEELELILIEYQPGAEAPPHVHPVVGLNYIVEGTAESQYEGGPLKTFHAGDSYQDLAGKKHLIFRNASKTQRLKFLVACKIRSGQPFAQPISPEAVR